MQKFKRDLVLHETDFQVRVFAHRHTEKHTE